MQTASDQNFVQNVTTTKVDQTTFTSFADTYPEGTTWWRVQAVDRNGNTLAWSAPRSFLKKSPVPQLLLPADLDTVPGDYTLSWAAQPYAASYDLEVYKGGDTSGNTVNRVINDSTDRVQYVLTNLDPSSGPYAWRVRRHDGKNRPGDWSPYRTFNVIRPGVTLISPADNDTAVPPSDQLFTWQPVDGATSYKFERRPGTSGSATETVTTPSTKWAPIAAIAGGSWQWRVTAYDTANNLIADSSWLHPFSVTDTPVATVPVSITGSGIVDSTLTLNPAQWNMPNNVLNISYQWFRGTSAVTGVTGVTYEVTSADIGKAITVRATATRPGYQTGTSISNAINGGQAAAPLASTPVVIAGSGFQGSTLTLSPPVWDIGGVATTYQWFRDTSSISGATGTTYVVAAADLGKDITVRATGTKAGYANGLSVSNVIEAALNPAPIATTPIALTGTGAFGSTLTATAPVWDTAGVTTTYEWFRDTTKITGQTGLTYQVGTADVGKSITIKATATKAGYVNGTSTSNGIVATQAASVTPTTLPSITGVPAAKETLTAVVGEWPGSRVEVLRLPVVRQRSGRGQGDGQQVRRPHPRRRPSCLGAGHHVDERLRTECGHERRAVRREADVDHDGERREEEDHPARARRPDREGQPARLRGFPRAGPGQGRLEGHRQPGTPDRQERRADDPAEEAQDRQAQADHHLPGQRVDPVVLQEGDDQGRQGQVVMT